jgi:hypothetical protein
MIGHLASWKASCERQALEVLWWDIGILEARVAPEPEPAVITGVSQHDAPLGSDALETSQTFVDQFLADSSPLVIRPNGDWTKSIPSLGVIADRDRGKGDMADDVAVLDGNQRNSQCVRSPQRINNRSLGLTAVKHIPERGGR